MLCNRKTDRLIEKFGWNGRTGFKELNGNSNADSSITGVWHVTQTQTRKRAIAKALQLGGHPDFAPVDLAYYQHFLGSFCSKILRFGKFCLATTNTDLLIYC